MSKLHTPVLIVLGLQIAVFLTAILWLSPPAYAVQTVPYKISFQGRLTNISGTALTGSYDMQFKLWTAAAVGSGTFVWGETRTAANGNAVTVTNGLFSVLIGEGTAVAGSSATLQAAVTANMNLYMEVTVGSEILSLPGNLRSQFGSSAYSINSDMLDGLDSSAFSQFSTANAFTNTNSITTASASAFVVNNGTSNIFKVDTSGTGQVIIGTSDTNGTVLVLDSNASDPTGANGAMYYSSGTGKFRCYQASAWADCITTIPTTTLQTGYTASTGGTTPEIKVSSVKGGITIQDADTTIAGTLFSVTQSNASNLGTAIFSVDSTGAVSLGLASTATTLPGNISATGTTLFKPTASVTNAFQIQNSASVAFFTIDTSTTNVEIGSSTTDATAVVFVVDSYNNATDPTGVNGGMYYNTSVNEFRCYSNGRWINCNNSIVAALTANTGAIANTETQVLGYTIPANSSVVGDVYRITAYYSRSGTNASSPVFRVRVGSTTLTGNIAATITPVGWATAVPGEVTALVTIRATGASGTIGGGMTEAHSAVAPTFSTTTPVAIDTTAAKIIELTAISGQNTNNYTFSYATIERLNN